LGISLIYIKKINQTRPITRPLAPGRFSLKVLFLIFSALCLSLSFLPSPSAAKEGESEEYVYLLKAEGGKVYRLVEKAAGGKNEPARKEIRRMELISPGTTLEIEKGVSVSLTCGGCRVLNLTHKDSPYRVKMEDFKNEGSTSSKIMGYFTMALNNYIHPDSKPGSKVHLSTRGYSGAQQRGLCKDLWPAYNADIMLIEPITFKWGAKGNRFSMEIKDLQKSSTVYSEKTMFKKVDVPPGILKPGRRYEWFLVDEETGQRCRATFALLSKDESSRIMEVVNNLPALLPPETDMETKYRLQAGYLASEGLHYDAWKWLEQNGRSQQDAGN
jgi:hypothetical protein